MIRRWNEVVSKNDTVYHLGDFAFNHFNKCFYALNGNKILIKGNHDKSPTLKLPWGSIHDILEVNHEGQKIVLCHYAMRVWNASHRESWMLYGHSHGKLPPIMNSFDVGVDTNNFYPWSFKAVKEKIEAICEIK